MSEYVSRYEGIKGGRPVVTGTKLSVLQVVDLVEEGLTPEEIAEQYPDVDSADMIQGAIDWADNHPEQIERLRERREAALQQLQEDAVVV